jgi:integrase
LEDFDWENELLFVARPKTGEKAEYPLSRVVGDAVLRYLQEVRPRTNHREVFLTLSAPFRPLRTGLWAIVASRLRPLGVSIPHYGPHALRHACATRLLDRGLSIKEIADHLGHRDPDSTRIYAKVDLHGLRQVADFDLGGLE